MPHPTPLLLLPAAEPPTRSASRSPLITAAGGFDREAIMRAAHAAAREDVAHAASRGRVRRYKIALRDALKFAWSDAHAARYCFERDQRLVALPAAHVALLNERTAALMIDSGRRMVAEVATIEARAAAMGFRL